MARVKTTTRVAASGRVRLRNLRSSLHTVNTTDTVSAPFTFSQNGFTLTFAYKMTDFGPGNPFANAEGWFNQLGSLSYARQGTNDVQIYAYLNASADFAGPRRMRFGNIPFPKGDGRWHRQTILIYVNASNHAICDIYEDGVALSLGNTVNYTGDVATPSGNLRFCGSTANSARGWMSGAPARASASSASARWRAPEPERHRQERGAGSGGQPALAKAAHERASGDQGIVT